MKENIKTDSIYCVSKDIVSREIEDELIIIPISSGIGDAEDDMYSLNETGRSIWDLVDGKNSIGQITEQLRSMHDSSGNEIDDDVIGLISELLKRNIVKQVK